MNTRTMVMIGVLVLLGLGAVWLLSARQDDPLEARARQIAGGPLVFSMNGEALVEEVKVVRPAPPDAAAGQAPVEGVYVEPTEQLMWHLVPRELREGQERKEPKPVQAITYGRRVPGLRPAPNTPRDALPLEPGERYLMTAATSEGDVTLEFEAPGVSGR